MSTQDYGVRYTWPSGRAPVDDGYTRWAAANIAAQHNRDRTKASPIASVVTRTPAGPWKELS